jgi:hypothetical protein
MKQSALDPEFVLIIPRPTAIVLSQQNVCADAIAGVQCTLYSLLSKGVVCT